MAPFIRYFERDAAGERPDLEVLINAAEIAKAEFEPQEKTLTLKLRGESEEIVLRDKDAMRAIRTLRKLR